jgi:hypothetical protein
MGGGGYSVTYFVSRNIHIASNNGMNDGLERIWKELLEGLGTCAGIVVSQLIFEPKTS